MRALPNVVHVGDTTRGAFSDLIEKPLPNGWSLALPAEIYRDPAGRSYEVQGLPPHVKREIFPPDDLSGGHARCVLSVMDEIRRASQTVPLGSLFVARLSSEPAPLLASTP
jgi:carboxyl-terminal processing protease